ncbi:MAG: NUDIX domain-containing protein [Chloroflexi bacterium]|nr:NUDIX domain-containing protein [Chloroflexota bacterium]
MERHFTVSGFVVEDGRTLLHWHRKLQLWLPAGGHIDPDEDMIQAVVREALEETGITCEVVPHEAPLAFTNIPQLPAPLKIIIADVGATDMHPAHQHIDMSYALRPVPGIPHAAPDHDHGFMWVSAEELRRNEPLRLAACGVEVPAPEDVRVIGLRAIELVMGTAR